MNAKLSCILLCALGAGCDLLVVEAELDEVCLSGIRVEVEGGPYTGTVERSVIEDGVRLPILEELDAEVRLLGVELALISGAENFAFLDELRVGMAAVDPAASLPALELAELSGGGTEPQLFLGSKLPTDLADYLRQDELEFLLSVSGELPDRAWVVELDLCFALEVEYR